MCVVYIILYVVYIFYVSLSDPSRACLAVRFQSYEIEKRLRAVYPQTHLLLDNPKASEAGSLSNIKLY